jgi:antitoxin HicB
MSQQPRYTMVIQWSDEDQAYIVSFTEWEAQGLIGHTHGETYEDAARKGREVLHKLVECARAEGEPLPAPRTHDCRYTAAGSS